MVIIQISNKCDVMFLILFQFLKSMECEGKTDYPSENIKVKERLILCCTSIYFDLKFLIINDTSTFSNNDATVSNLLWDVFYIIALVNDQQYV